MIHRPRYDDWSLPKGKLHPGEDWEAGALREVREETGFECELREELESATYLDRKGRRKLVRYWLMRPLRGEFEPGDEADELRWLTPAEADGAAELRARPRAGSGARRGLSRRLVQPARFSAARERDGAACR